MTGESKGMMWFTISKTSAPDDYIGLIVLMTIEPHHKSIEFGVVYSKELQRSTAGTESVFLLLKYCFELGYVRIEWICEIENKASRAAALRYGFKHEGIIRRHLVGLFCLVFQLWLLAVLKQVQRPRRPEEEALR